MAVALGSSLASSGGLRTAAVVGVGAEAAVVAGTTVDVESCAAGLGASETGEAAAAGFDFFQFKKMCC